MSTTQAYEAAVRFRSWGFSVFPVDGVKVPTVRWLSRQKRRPTLQKLFNDFRFVHPTKGPAMGVAVVHGAASRGLACRDFDVADAYHRWAEQHPSSASRLPTVATRRGFHVWFRTRTETFANHPDGELRADRRHYSVLPPSVRTDTPFAYQWHRNEPTSYRSFPIIDPVRHGLTTDPQHFNNNLCVPCFHAPPSPCVTDLIVTPEDDIVDQLSKVSLFDFRVDIRNSIVATLPRRAGERNMRLFLLARRLKTIDGRACAGDWEDVVRAWWQSALPVIGTKDFKTSWDDFVRGYDAAWPIVETPTVLSEARGAAAAAFGSDAKVLAVCQVLAGESADRTFRLASTLAADLAGLSQKTAYNTLMRLVDDGQIVLVERAKKMARGTGHVYRMA